MQHGASVHSHASVYYVRERKFLITGKKWKAYFSTALVEHEQTARQRQQHNKKKFINMLQVQLTLAKLLVTSGGSCRPFIYGRLIRVDDTHLRTQDSGAD